MSDACVPAVGKAATAFMAGAKVKGDLHGTTLSHTTGLQHELFRVNQTYNSLTTVFYDTKKCRRILKHVLKGDLHGTTVACDKLTTGLRHELFRVNQTHNSLTTAVYVTKNVVGF